ncbi:tubby and related proteins [Marchantia polymorpha subsp. ruderalis]|uniref:Tubby C-terminal domain-containing protein n=2 Tax=Marchantia polymorpha TaxID=3197 RepID=A0A176VWR8_MARPO|nr:hypothetical protein AXG93_197s1000 [Marchantia polymorpha subsp. ruderalis]PTQ28195.1 hypothetical protein MARPO_0170s0003 [Marchantia polymorpha]BBN15072.1 hypothetical protein Mp_6g16740 [Marchantia polymorpha subsp. ruderalis]|eukprot:PTQ28195.1 hypothetical protein MARPO_0170s0003 [Marchantia polymorpha]
MGSYHHSDHCRVVPGVLQPHHVDPREDVCGVFQPAPKDRLVQCFIVRDPSTQALCLFLQLSKKLSTVTNRGKFLVAARQVTSMASSDFMICGDLDDLCEQSEFYYGRLRSNLSRTEYTLWDCREGARRKSRTSCWPHSSSGLRPGSVKVADIGYNMTFGKPQKIECLVHSIRYCEVNGDSSRPAAGESSVDSVSESTDVLSNNYVRTNHLLSEVSQNLAKSIAAGAGQMSQPEFTLDKLLQSVSEPWSSDESLQTSPRNSSQDSVKSSPAASQDRSVKKETSPRGSLRKSLPKIAVKKIDEARVGDAVVDAPLHLKTRAYVWDKACKRYYADFNRGDIPGSAKNFQLVAGNHVQKENDKILLQFGQAGPEIFFMDYRYPLTAFEAFGICLSRLF